MHILEQRKICGRTIAVLGGGFNKIYPKENEWLFHKILENCGCIISEYAPNVDADMKNFPKRIRIVSGIADAVLVVEAQYRSGTSITAKYAKEQERILCCLPSNIDNKCGIGTNRMIQEGAKLITKPNEIINLLHHKEKYKSIANENKKVKNKIIKEETNVNNNIKKEEYPQIQNMPKEYEEIYSIIKEKQIHINEICKILKKDVSQIMPILTILEIEGYIEQLVGNEFKIKDK